jgi:hypothetical protein
MGEDEVNYDPNLISCGRIAEQHVRLTFGKWEHRATVETVVNGNCTGLDVIECAIANAYDHLTCDIWENKQIIMTKEEDEDLICGDDEGGAEDWLKSMLIAAEIVDIKPEKEAGK